MSNYPGGATLSGNLSTTATGCGLTAASACTPSYEIGRASCRERGFIVTAYKAEYGRVLTVSDGLVLKSSGTFTVTPSATLGSFSFGPTNNRVAGTAVSATVTVVDVFDT